MARSKRKSSKQVGGEPSGAHNQVALCFSHFGHCIDCLFLSLNCLSYRLRRGMYTSEHKRKAKGQVEFPAGGMLVFFASGWGAVGITHFASLRLFFTLHAYITKKVLFYSVVGLF